MRRRGFLWGSDWPHPQYFKPMPNDVALLDMMLDWVPDEKTRKLILVDIIPTAQCTANGFLRFFPIGSRARFILEPETNLLQACQRGLTVFVLDFLGQARCIGDGVNLLVGLRHDHD